jgi:hypothetical protein
LHRPFDAGHGTLAPPGIFDSNPDIDLLEFNIAVHGFSFAEARMMAFSRELEERYD